MKSGRLLSRLSLIKLCLFPCYYHEIDTSSYNVAQYSLQTEEEREMAISTLMEMPCPILFKVDKLINAKYRVHMRMSFPFSQAVYINMKHYHCITIIHQTK